MSTLFDVLRHLVTYGPARDQIERDLLLGIIDAAEHPAPAAPPAEGGVPVAEVPAQPGGSDQP